MTARARPAPVKPTHDVRIVSAASLFDGHDAAINIMRRLIQAAGCEVIHLGHNRTAADIVDAAIHEDAQGVAISSYQGGHMEYFKYIRDLLVERGAGHVRIFGGGGGTITPDEAKELHDYGIARIYDPEDGRQMGLQGMIDDLVQQCDWSPMDHGLPTLGSDEIGPDDVGALARAITLAESAAGDDAHARKWQSWSAHLAGRAASSVAPVIGITGTGGAGKSSLVDELVRRYVEDFPERKVAVLSVDPTKRRTGGALLGDRIRMNSLALGNIFMRSLATRGSGSEVSGALDAAITLCRAAGFDLVVAETSGIGQADASIVDLVDLALYVMTPEFGAQTQLEKIEMIDLAGMVVVNKFDKPGALDALRDVRKAFQRAHGLFDQTLESMPVYASMASQWGDRGTNRVYVELLAALHARSEHPLTGRFTDKLQTGLPDRDYMIPPRRVNYLGEVADTVRRYKERAHQQAHVAAELQALRRACRHLLGQAGTAGEAGSFDTTPYGDAMETAPTEVQPLMAAFDRLRADLDADSAELIEGWPALRARYLGEVNAYEVRGRTIEVANHVESLSHQQIARVALPRWQEWGPLLRWRLLENVPGAFPFTAGVFPFKRSGEDPARMFAGEGGPWRTNKRFHLLSEHAPAKRLSTAFDSVTLYGDEPHRRPDIWGKVGNSGVSIAHVEDMEALYSGFDLCSPKTSVSMTINGPAPAILAFFFNTAVRQQARRFLVAQGRIDIADADCLHPDGGGHPWAELRAMLSDEEYETIRANALSRVRGTVQADILKEDQAQNTCIFSTEFALKLMGDVQQYFVDHKVRNFYSVSISGYHIAEAGANPISQLAFTLANGFTFVEYYKARGMKVDDFAPNFSFFFSNGMDPEYAAIGRVARRIWSTALRDLHGAGERAQKLKYHIQTSGRSLHAQEIAFNDIRTTLQALLAIYDNCNSLHTNAYDEAITTPTEESVRRALAIQLILNKEFGVARNENPNQGAFILDELTELVEEAVLAEFDRLSERGGVLGAMERMYQRTRIQEESLEYEHRKHSGALPIVGVNTFTNPDETPAATGQELIRSSEAEKEDQLNRLLDFQSRNVEHAPAAIEALKATVLAKGNVFEEMMRAAEVLSLGQISRALYEVGGQYRRSM